MAESALVPLAGERFLGYRPFPVLETQYFVRRQFLPLQSVLLLENGGNPVQDLVAGHTFVPEPHGLLEQTGGSAKMPDRAWQTTGGDFFLS